MKETLNLKNVAEVLREKGADALRFLQDLADSGLTLSKDVLYVLAPLGLAATLAACGGEGGGTTSTGGGSTINVPAGVNIRDSAGGEGMDGQWYGGYVGSGPATIYNASPVEGAVVDGDNDGDSSSTWWCGEFAGGSGQVCVAADVIR